MGMGIGTAPAGHTAGHGFGGQPDKVGDPEMHPRGTRQTGVTAPIELAAGLPR